MEARREARRWLPGHSQVEVEVAVERVQVLVCVFSSFWVGLADIRMPFRQAQPE